MKAKKKLYNKLFFTILIIYVAFIFAKQQKTLNSYKAEQAYYNKQIEVKLAQQEELNETKNNINSEEYIEKMAREKLDMYLPNERVFIDTSK